QIGRARDDRFPGRSETPHSGRCLHACERGGRPVHHRAGRWKKRSAYEYSEVYLRFTFFEVRRCRGNPSRSPESRREKQRSRSAAEPQPKNFTQRRKDSKGAKDKILPQKQENTAFLRGEDRNT